jgi:hypothetical protein
MRSVIDHIARKLLPRHLPIGKVAKGIPVLPGKIPHPQERCDDLRMEAALRAVSSKFGH